MLTHRVDIHVLCKDICWVVCAGYFLEAYLPTLHHILYPEVLDPDVAKLACARSVDHTDRGARVTAHLGVKGHAKVLAK